MRKHFGVGWGYWSTMTQNGTRMHKLRPLKPKFFWGRTPRPPCKNMYWLGAVLAKYARHVRQTSADVRQRTLTLPDILSGRFQYMKNVRQGRQELPDIFARVYSFLPKGGFLRIFRGFLTPWDQYKSWEKVDQHVGGYALYKHPKLPKSCQKQTFSVQEIHP